MSWREKEWVLRGHGNKTLNINTMISVIRKNADSLQGLNWVNAQHFLLDGGGMISLYETKTKIVCVYKARK